MMPGIDLQQQVGRRVYTEGCTGGGTLVVRQETILFRDGSTLAVRGLDYVLGSKPGNVQCGLYRDMYEQIPCNDPSVCQANTANT